MSNQAMEGVDRGPTPLVRATRNQAEIDYLPPFGDPEVDISAEIAVYVGVWAIVIAVLDRLRR